jgi:hypothetical protein
MPDIGTTLRERLKVSVAVLAFGLLRFIPFSSPVCGGAVAACRKIAVSGRGCSSTAVLHLRTHCASNDRQLIATISTLKTDRQGVVADNMLKILNYHASAPAKLPIVSGNFVIRDGCPPHRAFEAVRPASER